MSSIKRLETAGLQEFRYAKQGGELMMVNALEGLAEVIRAAAAHIAQPEIDDVDHTGLLANLVRFTPDELAEWAAELPGGTAGRDLLTSLTRLRAMLPEADQ